MRGESRDLPILFSAPMILALLREAREPGTGKTQTRRILKPQPIEACAGFEKVFAGPPYFEARDATDRPLDNAFPEAPGCVTPYPRIRFAVGDRLWVRESWAKPFAGDNGYIFRADGPEFNSPAAAKHQWGKGAPWRVSIHMPRVASRLTLTVTDVRVERVNDISWHDALAEGVVDTGHRDGEPYGHCRVPGMDLTMEHEPETVFAALWERIHGDGAWARNDWVTATTFTVAMRNIDQ
jgi:hypothetical protein